MLQRRPVRRNKNGTYAIKITDDERQLLSELPGELVKLLESGQDDRSLFRLFPRAYENDLGRQVEYDRLMRDDLQSRHVEALQMLEQTADEKEISEEQIDNWVRAINQLRLVLGTRLNLTEESTDEDFPPDSPAAAAYAMYSYLTDLQLCAVEAMSETYANIVDDSPDLGDD
jgi:hypothetical protein